MYALRRNFFDWCTVAAGVSSIIDVKPLHVAAWIESKTHQVSAPTVKQHLAAIRHLFDWLVTGQIVPVNPASSVHGPSHVVKTGKTPILDNEEARYLLACIDISTQAGLRDRALIALMVYSFARIGAALGMKVEDVYTQNRRLWVRLREKGGKRHECPVIIILKTISLPISTARDSATTLKDYYFALSDAEPVSLPLLLLPKQMPMR